MDPLTHHVVRNYQVDQEIGGDGYCRYFKATSSLGEGTVTIAMLRPLPLDAAFPGRFQAQTERAAALDGHGLLRMLHAVQEPQGYFLVLDYCGDQTLYHRVLAQPYSPDQAMATLAALADTLQYLHRSGLVHGALHPQAIFLGTEGPRLGWLGVARAVDPISLAAGNQEPAFLAPEQCQGLPADGRSDLYTLGLLLWFMVTGQVPPLPPGPLPRTADPRVDALLGRLLTTSPRQRPRSARRVGEEIAAAQAGQPLEAVPPPPGPPSAAVSSFPPLPPEAEQAPPTAITLGLAAYQDQRFEEAVRLLSLAAASSPRNVRVLGYLGSALYQCGRHQEAAAVFQNAVQIRPESGRLRYNLGNALLACGCRKAALAAFQVAWEADPHCTAALLAITRLEKETSRD